MTWREQLQPASFRGVPFMVASHDKAIGRRTQVHEFPLRDKPFVEDLGRKARSYNIDAYVIGSEYIAQRDALIEAIEKSGSGTLVHRYFGQLRVHVTESRIRESNTEGGWAKFTLSFVESGDEPRPVASNDTRQKVATSADNAIDVIQQQFTADYSVDGLPGWVTDSAFDVLQELDQALSTLSGLDSLLRDFVSVPTSIADSLVSTLSGLSGLSAHRSLSNFGDDLLVVPDTTRSRRQQAANQQAIINLVQQTALIESVRQSSDRDYDSQRDAIAVRDELADALDDHMLTADDDTYLALQVLRSDVVRDLSDRAAKLKQVKSYVPKITLPALVIAHTLYQDALRDEDIVARNPVSHPGFVMGGQTLEVLNA